MKYFTYPYRSIAPLLLALATLQNASATGASACLGRYSIATAAQISITNTEFQIYWGDIRTYRESASMYEHRLSEALAGAQREGALIEPPEQINRTQSAIFVRQEELGPPFDPNASEIVGLAHIDGVTFEYKKRTVNRLRELAKERTRLIIEAAQKHAQQVTQVVPAGFCLTDGTLHVPKQANWREAVTARGILIEHGIRYHFLLQISPALTGERAKSDLAYRRSLMQKATSAQSEPSPLTRPVEREHHRRSLRLLTVRNKQMPAFPVLEIEKVIHFGGVQGGDRITVHIWPEDPSHAAATRYLASTMIRSAPPSFLEVAPAPPHRHFPTEKPEAPAVVESKMPWSTQLKRRQTDQPLAHALYELRNEGKTVFRGRTNDQGFTMTQNVDYFEQWDVVVLEPSAP
jgi:hypothetical protein